MNTQEIAVRFTAEYESMIREAVNFSYIHQRGTESYERATLLAVIDSQRSRIAELERVQALLVEALEAAEQSLRYFGGTLHADRCASALAQMQKAEQQSELWCIHVPGPDEHYAAPSWDVAQIMADKHNAAMVTWRENHSPSEYHPSIESVTAVVTLWPSDAESHAEELSEFNYADWGIASASVAGLMGGE